MSPRRLPFDTRDGLQHLENEGRFEEALQFYLASDSPERCAPEARLIAARCAARLGSFDISRFLAMEALAHFEKRHDCSGELQALNILGGIALESGELQAADAYFLRVAQLAHVMGESRIECRAWINMGSCAHARGEMRNAVSLFMRALKLQSEDLTPTEAAQLNHNLAMAFREIGELDKATAHVTRAIRLATQTRDGALLALALMGRVELAITLGALSSAEEDLAQAADLARSAGDEIGIVEAARLRALIFYKRGRYAESCDLALEARRRADRLSAAVQAADCAALAAQSMQKMRKADDASAMHAEALRILESRGADNLRSRVSESWRQSGA